MFRIASNVFFNKISSVLSTNKKSKLEDSLCKIHKNIYSSVDTDSILVKWSRSLAEWRAKESPSDNSQLAKFFQPSETSYDIATHTTFAMFELSIITWSLSGKYTPPKLFFPGLTSSSKPFRHFRELSKVIAVLNNALTEILVNACESIVTFIQIPYLTTSKENFASFFRAYLVTSEERSNILKLQKNVLLDAAPLKSIPSKPSDSLSKVYRPFLIHRF